MRGASLVRWCRWLAAAAVIAAAPVAEAQEASWSPAAEASQPATPSLFSSSQPRARGWLGLGFGAVADAAGGGYLVRASGGRPVRDGLRLDVVATMMSKKETLSADGLVVPGLPVISRRFLQHDAAWLQLVLGWEKGRLEPWVGAGYGLAWVRAEAGGPVACGVGSIFCPAFETRTDTATRSGPVLSAGANLSLSRRLVLGLEVHEPLFPAARFDAFTARATLARPIVMLTFSARLGHAAGDGAP